MSLRNDPDKFYKVGKMYEFKAGGTDTRKARKYIRKHKLKANEVISKSLIGVCTSNSMVDYVIGSRWNPNILSAENIMGQQRIVTFKIIMSTEDTFKIGKEYKLRHFEPGKVPIFSDYSPFKAKAKEI